MSLHLPASLLAIRPICVGAMAPVFHTTKVITSDLWNCCSDEHLSTVPWFLNQARAAFGRMRLVSWNCFGLHIGMCVCVCVSVSACPPPRALITSGMCDVLQE